MAVEIMNVTKRSAKKFYTIKYKDVLCSLVFMSASKTVHLYYRNRDELNAQSDIYLFMPIKCGGYKQNLLSR